MNKKNVRTALIVAITAPFFIIFLTLFYLSYLNLIACADVFYIIACILSAVPLIFCTVSLTKETKGVQNDIKPKNKKAKRAICASSIVLSISYLVFIGLSKYFWCYGKIDGEQIFYHTLVSSAGMDFTTVFTIAIPTILGGIIFAIVQSCFIYSVLYLISMHQNTERWHKWFKVGISVSSVVSIILAIIYVFQTIPILSFIYYQNFTSSSFIEEHYVDPAKTEIAFPEEKRNLIYIYLESMENSFADKESGGAFSENYISELTQLQKDNYFFSNTDQLGGALTTYGMTYTTASMFSQSFGIPLKIGNSTPSLNGHILPNTTNIYDILDDAGYAEYIVMGSGAEFGGIKSMLDSHGDVEIFDYDYMVDTGFIDKNYRVFWGVEDKKVYDFSKDKITEISQNKEPFFFVMQTVDTHNTDGWFCQECKEEHDTRYANVLSCASRQVNDFVEWAKTQPWYKNTTIVIVGDHPSMKKDFFINVSPEYKRTTTNVIINPAQSAVSDETVFTNRQFCSMDLFPTALAAIGCEIEGDRLGLGTNLFSSKQTIFEEYGFEHVNEEFRKKSTVFTNIFE